MNNSTIGNCLIGVNLFAELISIEEVLQQLLNLGRPKIVKTTQIPKFVSFHFFNVFTQTQQPNIKNLITARKKKGKLPAKDKT
jgi:hypothetical protein